MDPLSHLVVTRLVIGPGRAPLAVALAPDLPFYSCYPAWVVRRGLLATALRSGTWPEPPIWILPLTYRDLHASRTFREQHGLMVNDSLIVAVMQREGITYLATNDPDFGRAPGLAVRVLAP